MRRRLAWSIVLGLLALVPAAAALQAGLAGAHTDHRARHAPKVLIRWTSYGIPHIWAKTYEGAGEGWAYAFAQDDICTMAEDYVTVDGQRSRYFGPNGTYYSPGNATTANNLDSDFYWQQVIDSGVIDKLVHRPPPLGPVPQLFQIVKGYVKGYNRYLASVGGADGIRDPRCHGKPWVHPIGEGEVYRRLYELIELASGGLVINGIGEAQPPAAGAPVASLPAPDALGRRLNDAVKLHAGSNAVAVGRAGTRDHRHGLLIGNPHFSWVGNQRFFQAQITVPGKMNVSGASLFGVPLVLIGHTSTMAWSHTVSTARRLTPFQLTLVPGSPTTYLYDGKPVEMTHRTVTVQALQPDGSVKPVTRTLYSTRFGPVFDSLAGIPLPWTPATAFAMGDANADDARVANTFFGLDHARNVHQVLKILQDTEGIPWVNTLAADKNGDALYADVGSVPNVSDAKAAACDTALGAATFKLARIPILDGSKASCNWDTSPGAVEPGLMAPSQMPYLFRDDYVTNSNDSYWLSNPEHPLTGFAQIIGDSATARTLRTRSGLIMTQQRIAGKDGFGRPGFTLKTAERMTLSDQQYGGQLVRDSVVSMCRSMPGGMAPTDQGPPVAVGNACDVLAHWDLHEDLDSHGAILFRLFWDRALASKTSPWSVPFNADDPVHTPNTLNTSNPEVQAALGDAISDLQGAHIPLDAAPALVQGVHRNGKWIPLPGGPADPNGEFNAMLDNFDVGPDFVAGKGFPEVNMGSSFIQVVTWNKGRCPVGASLMTYSQSDDPTNPHYDDQTQLFSRKRWVPDRFCRASVLRDTKRTLVLERAR